MSFILAGCTGYHAESADFELVWSEEFSGESIDSDTWVSWEGPAYNEELQYYSNRPENAYVEDGRLYLVAQKESYKGYEYTSARISTDSTRIGWEQGRFEALIKMPEGRGFWPAFWLMPMRDDGWPRGGEIDIMEYRGNEPFTTTGAVHYWVKGCEGSAMECRKYITDSYTNDSFNLSEDFHLYALEWDDEGFTWFFDDLPFMQISFNEIEAEFQPFSTPFHIILNLAVGGTFLPNPDESTVFPQALVVEYVRVYQKRQSR
jgi:beta-glucanase (GH16 family)